MKKKAEIKKSRKTRDRLKKKRGTAVFRSAPAGPEKGLRQGDFQGHLRMLKFVTDAAILTDADGRILYLNRRAEEYADWNKKEAFAKNFDEVFHIFNARAGRRLKNILKKLFLTKQGLGMEKDILLVSRKGTERYVVVRISLVRTAKGKVIGAVIIFHDITKEREAAEVLKEKEIKYRRLFEASTDAIFIETVSGRIIDCNSTACMMYGYDRPVLLRMTVADLVPKEIALKLPDIIIDQLTRGGIFIEALGKRKNGTVFPTEVSTRLVTTGREQYLVVFVRDISERKKIQEDLAAAFLYNRRLFEASLDPLMTLSADRRIMDVNSAAELITGMTRDQLIGTDFAGYFTDPEKARAGCKWVFEEGTVRDYELQIRHKDGTVTPVLYNASVFWDKEGKVIGALAVARDISHLRKIESALRESENRFRTMAENTASVIFIHKAGKFIYGNAAAVHLTGYSVEEMIGMNVWDIIHPDYREMIKKQAQARSAGDRSRQRYELRIITKEGDVRWVDITTSAIMLNNEPAVIGTCFDITDRKERETAVQNEQQQLLSIFDSIDEAVYVADPETREILYVNQALKNLFGDVTGKKCHEALQNLGSPCSFCSNPLIFRENLGKTHIWEFQNQVTKKWYHCIDKAIRWPDGRMVRYEMAIDVDEKRKADEVKENFCVQLEKQVKEKTEDLSRMNEAYREKQKQQQALLDSIPDIAWLKDKESRFIAVNHAFAEAAGKKAEDLVGKSDLDIWPKDLAECYRSDDRQVMEAGAMKKVEEPLVDKDNQRSMIETIKVPIFSDSGEVIGTAGIARDVTKRKSAEDILRTAQTELEKLIQNRTEELARANDILKKEIEERIRAEDTIKHLAYHDALTGLPNRVLFDDRIGLALAQAKRYNQKVAVMFLDLDRFKNINDRLGHNVGDMLLKAVSVRLTELLRRIDTIARMGGDEFILLLTELKQDSTCLDIAGKILKMFERPFQIDKHEIFITSSIGIALYPDDGQDPETLVQNADIAMYYAKEQGRNKYFRYDSRTMDQRNAPEER